MVKKVQAEKNSEAPEEKKRKENSSEVKGFNLQKSIESLKKYFKDSFSELKKVHWPTRKQAIGETIIVIIITVFFITLVSLFDNIFSWFFNYILKS